MQVEGTELVNDC